MSGGVIIFTPPANANGEFSFNYTVTDPHAAAASAPITVTLNPVNDNPVAVDNIGQPTAPLAVTLNDSDVDDDTLVVMAVTQGSIGSVTFDDTTVTFWPNPGWTETSTDSFTYTISDGHGGTATATVTIPPTGSPLLAAFSRPASAAASAEAIDEQSEGFALLIDAARERWRATGVDTRALDVVQVHVVDLDGARLALAVTNTVLIDRDAAGFGWFIDATPGDDREFRYRHDELVARRQSEALGRMDLLTAVMHEMGHLLGLNHSDAGLMEETLDAGVRRLPDDLALMLALGQSPGKRHNVVDLLFAADLLI